MLSTSYILTDCEMRVMNNLWVARSWTCVNSVDLWNATQFSFHLNISCGFMKWYSVFLSLNHSFSRSATIHIKLNCWDRGQFSNFFVRLCSLKKSWQHYFFYLLLSWTKCNVFVNASHLLRRRTACFCGTPFWIHDSGTFQKRERKSDFS